MQIEAMSQQEKAQRKHHWDRHFCQAEVIVVSV